MLWGTLTTCPTVLSRRPPKPSAPVTSYPVQLPDFRVRTSHASRGKIGRAPGNSNHRGAGQNAASVADGHAGRHLLGCLFPGLLAGADDLRALRVARWRGDAIRPPLFRVLAL